MHSHRTHERSGCEPCNERGAFRIAVIGKESLGSGNYEWSVQKCHIGSVLYRAGSAVADLDTGRGRKRKTIAGLISEDIVARVACSACVSEGAISIESDASVTRLRCELCGDCITIRIAVIHQSACDRGNRKNPACWHRIIQIIGRDRRCVAEFYASNGVRLTITNAIEE